MGKRKIIAIITKKNKPRYSVQIVNGYYVVLMLIVQMNGNINIWQKCSKQYVKKCAAINKMKKLAGIKKYGIKIY